MSKPSQFFIFALLSFTSGLNAEKAEIEQQDITVIHEVQPGENLHMITRKYLGTDILWQENWKLNPHIDNPHQLKIGDKLTIIQERIIPAETAKVYNVVNRVEKKPTEGDWLSAHDGDELVQQEGVRTYAKSSALLAFNDESSLKVLEFSQIFLKSRSTGLTGTDSATIEVVRGDAELSWEPIKTDNTDITIVTGGTIAKPKAAAGQVAELRTGLTAAGNSVISVYKGNSNVASAGAEVNVKQGMGVMVKPGEAPPEPKPLLKAPQFSDSVATTYNYTNPWLAWSEVSGAADYLVEICASKVCRQILRQQKVSDNQWQLNDFANSGDYFIRVAAISADEMVGFKSEPFAITFTSAAIDDEPPLVSIDLSGQRVYFGDQLIVGANAEITIHALDALSGLDKVSYRWNEGAWVQYTGEALKLPENDSTLAIMAADRLQLNHQKEYRFTSM